MRNGGGSRPVRMTEMMMTAGHPDQTPARCFQSSENRPAVHVYSYTSTPEAAITFAGAMARQVSGNPKHENQGRAPATRDTDTTPHKMNRLRSPFCANGATFSFTYAASTAIA